MILSRLTLRRRAAFTAVLLCAGLAGPLAASAEKDAAPVTDALRERAIALLRQAAEKDYPEKQRWVKVHAAEYLIGRDYTQGVEQVFRRELERAGNVPQYRIGIWRVLARASMRPEYRKQWVDKIRAVFLDPEAPDRLHAVESLAKLGYSLNREKEPEVQAFDAAVEQGGPMAAYALWVLANGETEDAVDRLLAMLDAGDPATHNVAAYVLRHLPALSEEQWKRLARAAIPETVPDERAIAAELSTGEEPLGVHLVCAAAVHAPDDQQDAWKDLVRRYAQREVGDDSARWNRAPRVVRRYAQSEVAAERYQACETLAQIGAADDVPLLVERLDDPDDDVRVAAANAILRIDRRKPHHLKGLDWIVIALYAVGMIAVGWYYSRRTKSTEDYLLGGRTMRPLAVGLSLFASLLSTISYLAYPGEVIKHGPMYMFIYAAHPFTFLVVGWLMIPFIMKLKVTSAYEILEKRLGLGVRMLGSLFFLSLRLLWMAVIIYATTSAVLVPLLGLPSSATPYLCAVLGAITVVYTSMGGLRAVVLTDAIQVAILFGAAVATLVIVTVALGGVGAWFPTEWAPNWQHFRVIDLYTRITMVGMMLAAFSWWVCTSGSDQIAIQRYLATRDVKAARRVLFTSLASDVTVGFFLAMLGMALLAFFRANPHFMPDGKTILANADQLFPRFIAFGLPVGISGLVVAGLLAAAMSSLSSGVNSSCSVIAVDFIGRFRRDRDAAGKTDHVKLARYISVVVGVVVIFLSVFVDKVHGNLLEVAYKVVNLLVAPLFGLFFLAMFVRWAKGWATIVAAACGLAVVVAINYWHEFTGNRGISFIWAMPLGFTAEVSVGALLSLLPIGRPAPPLGGESA